ncbi:hypothetical protein GTP58_08430 [Duganella sp. CY15W]|uniref:trypsin-like serine peptidase n=1 Tax=Duganella sp. CY15W TaxID=2692172 RepID=UPI00136E88DD|nr:serine protease [Duganella sp. CY15W]MYM28348.1 hypothetical protein [Duganella sp. CY15W]
MSAASRSWRYATLLGAALTLAPVLAEDECGSGATMQTQLGSVIQVGAILENGGLNEQNYEEEVGKVRYFRALLAVRAPDKAKWYLTIRDQSLRPLEVFSSSLNLDKKAIWTRRLYGQGSTAFDLKADPGVEIEIRQVILMPDAATRPYYSLQKAGVYRFLPIEKAETGRRRLGDAVGMLMASWKGVSWCCSGVAVAENRLLTNWHCGAPETGVNADDYWNQDICDNTIIDMSWDGDGNDREFVCRKVIEKNQQKDYAILEIAARNGRDALLPAPVRDSPVAAKENIIIVHHPACRPKQVSLSCRVVQPVYEGWKGQGTPDFTHDCDTEAGSSGAPVFDLQNRLVGLHHLQFSKPGGVCDKVNKGIRIEEILARKP